MAEGAHQTWCSQAPGYRSHTSDMPSQQEPSWCMQVPGCQASLVPLLSQQQYGQCMHPTHRGPELTTVCCMSLCASTLCRCSRMRGLPWRPRVPRMRPQRGARWAPSMALRRTSLMPLWSYCSRESTRPYGSYLTRSSSSVYQGPVGTHDSSIGWQCVQWHRNGGLGSTMPGGRVHCLQSACM